MNKKKNYIEIILQIIFIFVIFLLFFFEKLNLSKIYNLLSFDNLDLYLFISFNNLAISILFYLTLIFIISKKLNIFKVCSIFLEGGLVKLILPGGDLIYRYIKFKNLYKINILKFSTTTILFSIFYKLSFFFLLVLFLSFINFFKIKSYILIIIAMSILVIFYILYYFRKKIYEFV